MERAVVGYVIVARNWKDHLSAPVWADLMDAVSWGATAVCSAGFVPLFWSHGEAEQSRLKLKDPDKWTVMKLSGGLFQAPSTGDEDT